MSIKIHSFAQNTNDQNSGTCSFKKNDMCFISIAEQQYCVLMQIRSSDLRSFGQVLKTRNKTISIQTSLVQSKIRNSGIGNFFDIRYSTLTEKVFSHSFCRIVIPLLSKYLQRFYHSLHSLALLRVPFPIR